MSRWNPKHQTTHIPRWPTQPTLLQKRVPIPTWFLPIFHKKFRMMPSTMLFLKVSMFHHQTQTVTYQSPKWLKMYKIPFINTLNCTSNNYSACFSKLTKHIGSFWQCILTLPHIAYLHASSVHYDEFHDVIDSGATHNMWTDLKVFVSFTETHNRYVSLAHNYHIPVKGSGTTPLNINGDILQLYVFYTSLTIQFIFCETTQKIYQLCLSL